MLATQKIALQSIMTQWASYTKSGLVLGSLKTHAQHKKALLSHLAPYIDNSFNKLKGREAYNSFVGGLQSAGLVNSKLVREVYTPEEAKFLASRGQRTDDIHIIEEALIPLK